jgi:signal transduction histidine kinase
MALRMLPAITQQAELSVSMMGALLSLARMSGEPLQRGPVALGALVQDVVAQLVLARPEAARVEVTATGLPVVQADAAMLRVAFVNLLGNAFKFSAGQDAPRVTVSADQVGQEGVVLHVQDNGPGFDAEAATNLFSPFVRLHGTLCEGHGLGLTIVRRVIERHGGRVWAESQPGQGARFSFTLPGAP